MARTAPSDIKCKIKKSQVVHDRKAEKAKAKLQRRLALRKAEKADPSLREARLQENQPATLENTREADETIVGGSTSPEEEEQVDPEADAEVFADEDTDEFASYFTAGVEPKVLVTTNKRASAKMFEFANEFASIFPNAEFVRRGSQFEVKRIVELANERGYTDVMLLHEDKKKPNAVTMIHLPHGPTATFKLTSIRRNKEIRNHGRIGPQYPELILNHFTTRLGHTVGRFLASLFPHHPEFKGRQVVTFHNQRDFIFFRRHRYIFKDGKRCDLQEIGPRFTLKLQSLQKGTFDTKYGEYEWMHRPELDTSRRKFFL